jgi:hypothetical protein
VDGRIEFHIERRISLQELVSQMTATSSSAGSDDGFETECTDEETISEQVCPITALRSCSSTRRTMPIGYSSTL